MRSLPSVISLAFARLAYGEGIHLVNCYYGPQPVSLVVYYSDDSHPVIPPPQNACRKSTGSYFYWETGKDETCRFSTGVTFKFNIEVVAQAPGVGDYSAVGYGSNGFKDFNCYKDVKPTLYVDQTGYCESIYYCLPK
ncbi:Iterative polyketide synthase afoE [Purpureocillium lavendulum]|uniref:Iterative polyketide synthase afoE n=1 Tax=Purpureocillium lavendulum TaxID=1247861 RepID=A0AB34FJC1_9HYPO|nr:Iterative polyketide synthase afoE [Purpureocillium lavendulum]